MKKRKRVEEHRCSLLSAPLLPLLPPPPHTHTEPWVSRDPSTFCSYHCEGLQPWTYESKPNLPGVLCFCHTFFCQAFLPGVLLQPFEDWPTQGPTVKSLDNSNNCWPSCPCWLLKFSLAEWTRDSEWGCRKPNTRDLKQCPLTKTPRHRKASRSLSVEISEVKGHRQPKCVPRCLLIQWRDLWEPSLFILEQNVRVLCLRQS